MTFRSYIQQSHLFLWNALLSILLQLFHKLKAVINSIWFIQKQKNWNQMSTNGILGINLQAGVNIRSGYKIPNNNNKQSKLQQSRSTPSHRSFSVCTSYLVFNTLSASQRHKSIIALKSNKNTNMYLDFVKKFNKRLEKSMSLEGFSCFFSETTARWLSLFHRFSCDY